MAINFLFEDLPEDMLINNRRTSGTKSPVQNTQEYDNFSEYNLSAFNFLAPIFPLSDNIENDYIIAKSMQEDEDYEFALQLQQNEIALQKQIQEDHDYAFALQLQEELNNNQVEVLGADNYSQELDFAIALSLSEM